MSPRDWIGLVLSPIGLNILAALVILLFGLRGGEIVPGARHVWQVAAAVAGAVALVASSVELWRITVEPVPPGVRSIHAPQTPWPCVLVFTIVRCACGRYAYQRIRHSLEVTHGTTPLETVAIRFDYAARPILLTTLLAMGYCYAGYFYWHDSPDIWAVAFAYDAVVAIGVWLLVCWVLTVEDQTQDRNVVRRPLESFLSDPGV